MPNPLAQPGRGNTEHRSAANPILRCLAVPGRRRQLGLPCAICRVPVHETSARLPGTGGAGTITVG